MGYTFTGSWVHDLDKWITEDPREDIKPVCNCCDCGRDIFEGYTYYLVKGDVWCEKCMDNNRCEAEFDNDVDAGVEDAYFERTMKGD